MQFDISSEQHGFILFFFIFLLLLSCGSLIQTVNLTFGVLVTEIILIFLPVYLTARILNLNIASYFRFKLRNLVIYVGSLILGFGATLLATGITAVQSKIIPFPPDSRIFLENMLKLRDNNHFLIFFLLVAVLPAICEEFLFRGYLMEYLIRRWNPWIGITISGACFAIFHLSYYRILPVAILGIIIGYTVWKTGSLLSGILIHILNNSFALTLLSDEIHNMQPPAIDTSSILVLLSLSGLFLGLGLGTLNLGEYISNSSENK